MYREIALVLIMKGKTMDAFASWLSENGLAIIGMVIAAVAVRGSIKFDVNQWLNDRRKRLEDDLRMLCPHHCFIKEGDEIRIASEFVSPPGTLAWQCQRCGHISYDKFKMEQDARYWAENPSALIGQNKKMKKPAKKLGR